MRVRGITSAVFGASSYTRGARRFLGVVGCLIHAGCRYWLAYVARSFGTGTVWRKCMTGGCAVACSWHRQCGICRKRLHEWCRMVVACIRMLNTRGEWPSGGCRRAMVGHWLAIGWMCVEAVAVECFVEVAARVSWGGRRLRVQLRKYIMQHGNVTHSQSGAFQLQHPRILSSSKFRVATWFSPLREPVVYLV